MDFGSKKNLFLSSIRGHKLPYKRVSYSPIRYAGGKSLAVGHIIEKLPEVRRIVSPFLGGGSVELACHIALGMEVRASDILAPLCTYWQVQIESPEALAGQLSQYKPTKEEYYRLKARLQKHWNKEIRLPPLEVAALYFYNHNLSYGPSFLGWPSKVYLSDMRYQQLIDKVRRFRVKAFHVSCNSFEAMFKKYPNDFFYCDPPYMLRDDCDESKMFAGIYPQRNFPIHHKGFDHEKLRDCLRAHKGGFILSYNDCASSKEWYQEYEMEYPRWQYTMGQGETRISHYRPQGTHIKQSHELLIYAPPT